MILILGKGDLAQAINSKLPDSICVGKPEFDFSQQYDCDRVINMYTPKVVINTVGVNQHQDLWNILTVNYTSAVYLTVGFYDKMPSGQIINISSASALWASYPDIDTGRFIYNISKENLSTFGRHFNRKIVDDNKNVIVTTAEIGKFPSKFNNYKPGTNIGIVADVIIDLIYKPRQQVTFI